MSAKEATRKIRSKLSFLSIHLINQVQTLFSNDAAMVITETGRHVCNLAFPSNTDSILRELQRRALIYVKKSQQLIFSLNSEN